MMRAKLYGYMDRAEISANRYPASDQSLPARYARAIAASHFSDARAAMGQIDALIEAQPQNPYFHELKGQTLLEAGKPAEAIAPLRRATQLAPNPALIQVMLGQALVESNDPAHLSEAISVLEASLARDSDSPEAYNQLAMAYGRKGDLGHADLASAQAALEARRYEGGPHARRPRQGSLPDRLARLGQGGRHLQQGPGRNRALNGGGASEESALEWRGMLRWNHNPSTALEEDMKMKLNMVPLAALVPLAIAVVAWAPAPVLARKHPQALKRPLARKRPQARRPSRPPRAARSRRSCANIS